MAGVSPLGAGRTWNVFGTPHVLPDSVGVRTESGRWPRLTSSNAGIDLRGVIGETGAILFAIHLVAFGPAQFDFQGDQLPPRGLARLLRRPSQIILNARGAMRPPRLFEFQAQRIHLPGQRQRRIAVIVAVQAAVPPPSAESDSCGVRPTFGPFPAATIDTSPP